MYRRIVAALVFSTFIAVSFVSVYAAPIQKQESSYQDEAYQQWWGSKLERKLAALPLEGKVPDFRVPYSGFIYPDRSGGTDIRQGRGLSPLGKYDKAFNGGRGLAVSHERMDITSHLKRPNAMNSRRKARLEQLNRSVGLFERMRAKRSVRWNGHCNGWTAAAIRHAEPQNNVVRNGVTFTPADIKGLLAELYMYTDTEFLGGVDKAINPGTLHLVLANWLGAGDYPIGMDSSVGEEVWNHPIYAYKVKIDKQSKRQAEVHMTITYADYSASESDKSPRLAKTLTFHYLLDLDSKGNIVGGSYYGDSDQIDMLWAPLRPTQGGTEGNKLGNPHLDCKKILDIWRDSVPAKERAKWLNIDPVDPKKVETEKVENEEENAEE